MAARDPHAAPGRSQELEKLLNSWGAQPTRTASYSDRHAHNAYHSSSDSSNPTRSHASDAYDAEKMIDELLASTWESTEVRRASLSALGSPSSSTAAAAAAATSALTAQAKTASFKQQTRSMNELQTVLARSIEKLVKHRQVISERIASLEKENQKASSKFHDGLKNPEVLLSQICVQMEDLEERFTKVSSTAVVIGDRLHALDQERTRVLETDEMMEALLALNDPASKLVKSSNRLFNTLQDPTQLHDAARVIKKMCVFSTELSSPAIAHAVSEIERLSQTIENSLLSEFSNAQDKGDVRGMHACAASLIEYTDKEKVADRYVWNVMKDQLAKNLSFTAVSSLDPIQDLETLFAKIRAICKDQFAVIHSVFPASARNSTRELLIERLFNDPAFGIFSYLDQFLNARRQSSATANQLSETPSADDAALEYVRLLCAAYEKTCDLALSIEAMDVAPSVHAPPAKAASPESEQPQDNPADDNVNNNSNNDTEALSPDQARMQTFLSLQLHSLFGGHRQRYFRTELDLVQSQFQRAVTSVKFPQPPAPKQKATATKSKHTSASAHAATASTPSGASSSSFERDGLVVAPTPESAQVLAFYDTLLAIADDDSVPELYHAALKDAVGRCEFILKDSDLRPELVTKLFASYVASFGDEYLGKATAMASDVLHEPLLVADSPRQFFNVLEHLLRQIDTLDDRFDALVTPALRDAPTHFTICYENKRRCLDKLERAIASGLELVFTVVEKHVSAILSTTQDKSDFVGSDANMSLASSRACRRCIDYLQPLVTTICRVLMEENREPFLITLAATFKDLYLAHVQRFRFDPDGACMLLRDVNAYRQIFRSFRHVAIDDTFDILHEVANVFALPPENLGGFVRDGKLARLPRQTLLDLVKRRWDYKTSADKIQV